MSKLKHETIADIVAEMRQSADGMEKNFLYDLREWGTDNLRVLADRIEEAAEMIEVKVEARQFVKDGVPIDRFNEVVMEMVKMRDGLSKQREINKELVGKNAELLEENARLRAALKPVLKLGLT